MNSAIVLSLTLVSAALGGLIGHLLRIPAGTLFGTLAGVAVGGGLLGVTPVPVNSQLGAILQISVGLLVGARISRNTLRSGAGVLAPGLILTSAVVATGILSAFVAAELTSLSLITALFAAVPGGLAEMAAVGASFGADGATVAAVHLTRVLVCSAAVSVLLALLRAMGSAAILAQEGSTGAGMERGRSIGLIGCVFCGVSGGIFGLMVQVPAGGIIGALLGAASFRLTTGYPVSLRGLQFMVQALSGGIIGLGVSTEFLAKLPELAGAGSLMIATQLLMWLVMWWVLSRFFGYDLTTAAFATVPGGMSEVIAASSEAGADVVAVAFVHLLRLSAIVLVVPALIVQFS